MHQHALSEVRTHGVSVSLHKLELRNCIYTVTITHGGTIFFSIQNKLFTVTSPLFRYHQTVPHVTIPSPATTIPLHSSHKRHAFTAGWHRPEGLEGNTKVGRESEAPSAFIATTFGFSFSGNAESKWQSCYFLGLDIPNFMKLLKFGTASVANFFLITGDKPSCTIIIFRLRPMSNKRCLRGVALPETLVIIWSRI